MESGAPTTTNKVPDNDPGHVLLAWRSHPAKHAGHRLWLAVGVVVIIPLGLWYLYSPFYALLGFVILGGSLTSFFLPTRYVLYAGGIESRFLGIYRRFTWDQFRSFYPDRHGVLLSPFLGPSRLENFRGVYLRFNGHKDDVLGIVRTRIATAEAQGGSAA